MNMDVGALGRLQRLLYEPLAVASDVVFKGSRGRPPSRVDTPERVRPVLAAMVDIFEAHPRDHMMCNGWIV